MNVQNIINEIKRENEEEKIRIKQRISQAAEEVKRVTKDFLQNIYQAELDIKKLQDLNLNNQIPEIIKEFKQCH